MITRADIETAEFVSAWHGNMGFVDDPDPTVDRHKGYAYGWRCIKIPRLAFEDRHYTLNDGGVERRWFVDGEVVDDLDAAIAALNVPPVPTTEEQAALYQLCTRRTWLYDDFWNRLAGCDKPQGGIMPGTPHQVALRVLDGLRDKGLVELESIPTGPPKYDALFEREFTPTALVIRGKT